jgi:hypothetical protein
MFMELFDTCYSRDCIESIFEIDGQGRNMGGRLLEAMLEVMEDDFAPPGYTHTVLVG